MSKYKVLLPTNGFEVGSEVELTEDEASRFNAGEPTPRVELVADAEASGSGEAPQSEGGEAPPEGGEPPANNDTKPSGEGEGEGEGAGANAEAGAGEGGENAGESNA